MQFGIFVKYKRLRQTFAENKMEWNAIQVHSITKNFFKQNKKFALFLFIFFFHSLNSIDWAGFFILEGKKLPIAFVSRCLFTIFFSIFIISLYLSYFLSYQSRFYSILFFFLSLATLKCTELSIIFELLKKFLI